MEERINNKKFFKQREEKIIKCECGYGNLEHNVKIYGTCLRCKRVLDPKAKFDYEMKTKLRLWRDKKWN